MTIPLHSIQTMLNLLLILLLLLAYSNLAQAFRTNASNNPNNNANSIHSNYGAPSSLPTTPPTGPATMTSTPTALYTSNSNDETFPDSTILDLNNLSVGFLGCGTIASSIARGLAKDSNTPNSISISKMVVSERSRSKSQALVDDLSGDAIQISRTTNNQAIVDECDLIFLTVLPQQASDVLQSLQFDPHRHVLVSLVSTANLHDLQHDSKLDLSQVAKMICLPSIANHEGVALLCCGQQNSTTNELLETLFDATGGVVSLQTEADLEACMVTTCTMGPLYGTMKNQRDWLLKQTSSLSKADATTLVVKQFAASVGDALQNCHENRLEDLIAEQTPGGLNEQALNNYGTVLNGFQDLQEPVMDAILSRIRGDTNGSIAPMDTKTVEKE